MKPLKCRRPRLYSCWMTLCRSWSQYDVDPPFADGCIIFCISYAYHMHIICKSYAIHSFSEANDQNRDFRDDGMCFGGLAASGAACGQGRYSARCQAKFAADW